MPVRGARMDLELLTVAEAADMLKLSSGAIYALCKSGVLPHHRLGAGRGAIRIDEADLRAYLAACKDGAAPGEGGPIRPKTSSAAPKGTGSVIGFKHLRLDRLLGVQTPASDPPADRGGHNVR
jgi:excisionase family DNA binding protein